jgi:hypothetical protein
LPLDPQSQLSYPNPLFAANLLHYALYATLLSPPGRYLMTGKGVKSLRAVAQISFEVFLCQIGQSERINRLNLLRLVFVLWRILSKKSFGQQPVYFCIGNYKRPKLFGHPRNPSQPPFIKGRRIVSPFEKRGIKGDFLGVPLSLLED